MKLLGLILIVVCLVLIVYAACGWEGPPRVAWWDAGTGVAGLMVLLFVPGPWPWGPRQ